MLLLIINTDEESKDKEYEKIVWTVIIQIAPITLTIFSTKTSNVIGWIISLRFYSIAIEKGKTIASSIITAKKNRGLIEMVKDLIKISSDINNFSPR